MTNDVDDIRISEPEIEIMRMLDGDPRPSIPEMAERSGRSFAYVHERLNVLANHGYVNPPPKPRMARAYSLTDGGRKYLQDHGYLPPNPVFVP
jgi:DNA-binding MarR family transcriptional regulator